MSREARRRLGGSALAQVYGQLGNEAPDLDDPARLAAFFASSSRCIGDGALLAYHDIADGGLFATLAEMAFASRCGLDVDARRDRSGRAARAVRRGAGRGASRCARATRGAVVAAARGGRPRRRDAIGTPTTGGSRPRSCGTASSLLDESRIDLHRAWSATTHALQRLRDNPDVGRRRNTRASSTPTIPGSRRG